MATAIKDVNWYKRDIVKKMKSINTYNKSFDKIIEVFAMLLYDYDIAVENFKNAGNNILIEHTNKFGVTNLVKNPLYLAIEKQRADIILYSRELGLTPSGLKKLNDQLNIKAESSLEKTLNALSKL